VQAIAIDIGRPGQDTAQLQADNTDPVVFSSWTAAHRAVTFTASASDLNSGIDDVTMGVLFVLPTVTFQAPPYQVTVVLPSSASSGDFWYAGCGYDEFGNETCTDLFIRVQCTGSGTSEVCTATPL